MFKPTLCLILCLMAFLSRAENTTILKSGEQQTTLIELYTSEGCSSCPPADNWLRQLKDDPKLWEEYIPIVFHVDYWDYIGWKDPFALAGNSQRQSRYKAENKIGFVYTPGFVVNGQEWQGWRDKRSLPKQSHAKAGVLKAQIKDNNVAVQYSAANQNLIFHIALLGFDIQSQVKAGENEGRTLSHDFVALSDVEVNSSNNQASLTLTKNTQYYGDRQAIAIWISTPDSQTPIQALGGWLP